MGFIYIIKNTFANLTKHIPFFILKGFIEFLITSVFGVILSILTTLLIFPVLSLISILLAIPIVLIYLYLYWLLSLSPYLYISRFYSNQNSEILNTIKEPLKFRFLSNLFLMFITVLLYLFFLILVYLFLLFFLAFFNITAPKIFTLILAFKLTPTSIIPFIVFVFVFLNIINLISTFIQMLVGFIKFNYLEVKRGREALGRAIKLYLENFGYVIKGALRLFILNLSLFFTGFLMMLLVIGASSINPAIFLIIFPILLIISIPIAIVYEVIKLSIIYNYYKMAIDNEMSKNKNDSQNNENIK